MPCEAAPMSLQCSAECCMSVIPSNLLGPQARPSKPMSLAGSADHDPGRGSLCHTDGRCHAGCVWAMRGACGGGGGCWVLHGAPGLLLPGELACPVKRASGYSLSPVREMARTRPHSQLCQLCCLRVPLLSAALACTEGGCAGGLVSDMHDTRMHGRIRSSMSVLVHPGRQGVSTGLCL